MEIHRRYERPWRRALVGGSLMALLAGGLARRRPGRRCPPRRSRRPERHPGNGHGHAEQALQGPAEGRQAIATSAGYAVFSNFGMKILVAGSGSGKGLAVNSKTRVETFMKMFEVQAGSVSASRSSVSSSSSNPRAR